MFALLVNQTAMKTIFTLLLLLSSVTVFAKVAGKNNISFGHRAQSSMVKHKSFSAFRADGLTEKRMQREKSSRRMRFGIANASLHNFQVKLPLSFARRERGAVAQALSHVYVKNGAAGFMGGWVNNVQLTFGWRYQPFRVLGSERPVPVHPLMMRVRVRI
jgi:hypothetical protein